ncbi:MAG: glutamate formimidoyltransferase [Melioribacteraceae bacterium]
MKEQLIECVPNFSEGRDLNIIKQITDEIEKVDNVKLLDVDRGADMNRTVVTFIGNKKGIKEAAFQAIKKASELIDMSKHFGSHPRMGATDVFPFIPVNGITIEECIQISKEVAQRVGDELRIPVYLYEKSAQKSDRKNLAVIRKGEYEGLAEKLKDENWKPDFGPTEFNKKSGATVIGVREFLIAYNINLNTREKLHAIDIAYELREKGRSARRPVSYPYYYKSENVVKYENGSYPCGDCVFIGKTFDETLNHCKIIHNYNLSELLKVNEIDPKNLEGESVKKSGMFQHCRAIGWMVKDFDRAQISINLADYNITSMHQVLEAARKLASERGLIVTGSEIVGMVPFSALLQTGKFYLQQQGRSTGIPIKDIFNTAVQSLGLEDLSKFNIEERVLGLPKNFADALIEMNLNDFVDEVSRESPAPGGGSIAALAGAIGASLSSMVCILSSYKKGSKEIDELLNNCANECQQIKDELLKAVDEDTRAFNDYMIAKRLPNISSEEKEQRKTAILEGLKKAVSVPLRTAELSLKAIEIAQIVVKHGNPNSITDVGVGAQMAYSGVLGGIYNVLVNLKEIKDETFCNLMKEKCSIIKNEAQNKLSEVLNFVESKLN